MILDGVSRFCFGASYAVAFALELAQVFWPRPVQRWLALGFGWAGLLAHSAFLIYQRPSLALPYGSLLFLAWVLAVFYIDGTIHHARRAWAIFVLPLVIGLIVLTTAYSPNALGGTFAAWAGDRFWGTIHGLLLFLAAVGVSVGFLASVMYLVQQQRLRAKLPPNRGLNMLALERLEAMNRNAINWAFPFLTVGLLVGAVLLARDGTPWTWASLKVLGTAGLWVVFLLLMYLRYGAHLAGRRMAWLTIVAFGLMLVTLLASHPVVVGGGSG